MKPGTARKNEIGLTQLVWRRGAVRCAPTGDDTIEVRKSYENLECQSPL